MWKQIVTPSGWRPGFAALLFDYQEPGLTVEQMIQETLAVAGIYNFVLASHRYHLHVGPGVHEVLVGFVSPASEEKHSYVIAEFQWNEGKTPPSFARNPVGFFYTAVQEKILQQGIGCSCLTIRHHYQQDRLLALGIARFVVSCRASLLV